MDVITQDQKYSELDTIKLDERKNYLHDLEQETGHLGVGGHGRYLCLDSTVLT